LVGHCTSPSGRVDCRPAYVDANENELDDFEASSREAGQLKSFGTIPLLVITQDINAEKPGKTAQDVAQDAVWEREQEASKQLSRSSWRVIARGSGHIVPVDRPDLVVAEVARLIQYLRGGPAPPFGTTSIH
jgi:hypothetical protein